MTFQSDLVYRYYLAGYLGLLGGKRDYNKIFGYPEKLTFDHFYQMYDRKGLARRLVTLPASLTWKEQPILRDGDEEETPFLQGWQQIIDNDQLAVFHYLERIDRISGIGRFGVLLLGLRSESDSLAEPLTENALSDPQDLLYFSPFHEGSVTILSYDTDVRSERYGRPEMYEIEMSSDEAFNKAHRKQQVHWTRVIHVAEDLEEDEVYGTPRLRAIYNDLLDLYKVSGAAPEIYMKAALRRVLFNVDADAEVEDEDALKQELEEFQHEMKEYSLVQGVTPHTIDSDIRSPKETYDIILQNIAGAKGYPKRLLTGSERGDLASSMDAATLYGEMSMRQEKHAFPRILRALTNRLIWLGILEAPRNRITAEWPPLFEMSEKEQAEIAQTLTAALKNLSPTPIPDLLDEAEARTEIFGWSAEPETERLATNILEQMIDEDEVMAEQILARTDEKPVTVMQLLRGLQQIARENGAVE